MEAAPFCQKKLQKLQLNLIPKKTHNPSPKKSCLQYSQLHLSGKYTKNNFFSPLEQTRLKFIVRL